MKIEFTLPSGVRLAVLGVLSHDPPVFEAVVTTAASTVPTTVEPAGDGWMIGKLPHDFVPTGEIYALEDLLAHKYPTVPKLELAFAVRITPSASGASRPSESEAKRPQPCRCESAATIHQIRLIASELRVAAASLEKRASTAQPDVVLSANDIVSCAGFLSRLADAVGVLTPEEAASSKSRVKEH
jgi:hypothetical protein